MKMKVIGKQVEHKEFYKLLLEPMSLEERLDQIWDLPEETLNILLKQFKADEEYEICLAFKKTLDSRRK